MAEPQAAASASAGPEEPPIKPQVDTSAATVEMDDLQTASAYATPAEERPDTTMAAATPSPAAQPSQSSPPSPLEKAPSDSAPSQPAAPASLPTAASSVSGVEPIGPSTTAATTSSETAVGGPSIHIILLLTTGARHPYKIDRKYLRKRDVEVEGNDPFNISVYTLKELIWRDWRKEWEPLPSSPAYIRLINMGRMLDDKVPLRECRFNHESPNIVHMTVRPQELLNDDDDNAKSGKIGRYRDDGEGSTAGCRCVIL